jgi:hypothetical protein
MTYPQIGSNRLSGDEDEWRILIRWKQDAPTALLTIPQALCEVERLQEADEHEIARRIRVAAEYAPPHAQPTSDPANTGLSAQGSE